MSDRQRNLFVLLLVAGLLIASAVVIASKPTKLGLDLQGGVELVYQVKPRAGQPPPSADTIQRTIDVMRERVDQLGVAEPEIQQAGGDQINVALPDVSNLDEAIKQVGTVAQLAFYDWEPNVIGPDGRPDPENAAVTGGQSAGDSGAALTLYDALLRAEKRPAKVEPEQLARRQAVLRRRPQGAKRVFGLGEETRSRGAGQRPGGAASATKPPPTSSSCKPDTVLLRAQKPTDGPKPNRWFVLQDDVALAGKEIKDPEQNFDQGTGGSGAPIVTFSFTDKGRKTWESVTKAIAQRGQASVGILSLRRPDPAALRDRARQRARLVADDRLPPVPGGHRRAQRLADRGRLHDRLRPGAGEHPQDRRAAGPARAHLELAGVGHARPPGAQPGPRRGHRGLRHRRAVPAALLPRPRRHRGRRARRLRRLLLRAHQGDPGRPHAARHRRPDPHAGGGR